MKLPTCSATRRPRRQHNSSSFSNFFTCSLVIALSSVLVISTVQCDPFANVDSKQPAQLVAPVAAAAVSASAPAQSNPEPVNAAASAKPWDDKIVAKSAAAAPAGAAVEQPKVSESVAKLQQESEQARKGRSEAPAAESASKTTDKPASKQAQEPQKPPPATSTSSAKSQASSKSQLSGKSGASISSSSGKKLPANLGTVTSTGSGGPAHYMSKHDAYSAIAEKHGALAQDAMRKPDKRQHHTSNLQQRFGGIQKASGLGELNPFKGDSGLARTLGASMRSIMKGKYSVPAYLASAVLGAVALMAFYESPISPLPVPALPEPPVGRFPPEMPVISPNLQVPFRTTNQQQGGGYGGHQQGYVQNNYANQRSSYQPLAGGQQSLAQQQPQQVLFPGATAQAAQQRQGSAPGPVQQLAANLISSVGGAANRPAARSDHVDGSSSRSFFGSSSQQQQAGSGAGKLSAPANQNKPLSAGAGLLSFLGLGSGTGAAPSNGGEGSVHAAAIPQQPVLGGLADIQRASGLGAHHVGAGGGPVASAPGHEHKGQSVLSNSHLVNKMKSYFDRPVAHSSWSMDHNVPNQYDQYRRMSIIQALAKDTAFLSSFFSPSRRSSNSTLPISASQLQQSINSVLSAATGGSSSSSSSSSASQQVSAARMQVDSHLPSLLSAGSAYQQQQQQQPIVNTKRASSGYGLMRAADRIGHALLDTFTSGLLHRSSSASGSVSSGADGASARKVADELSQQNALASATSLLSDIMSSYNAAHASSTQNEQHHTHVSQTQQQITTDKQSEQASARSADQQSGAPATQTGREQQSAAAPVVQQQQSVAAAAAAPAKPQSQSAATPESSSIAQQQQQQALSRKTRSVGLEYAIEPQVPMPPSRATQINNLVDYVSDSYKQNKMLVNFVMNQVGLSQALPYVDQFLGTPNEPSNQ